jgi:hypothetical protein
MTNAVTLSARDRSLLQLLSYTPATTSLLFRAGPTFTGVPFPDERRLRERLQALERAGFVRHWSLATVGGGLQNYYKLTPAGFQALFGPDALLPPRAFFAEIAPTFLAHTLALSEVLITTLVSAHDRRITVERVYRENELSFTVGDEVVQPDFFLRLTASGRAFNLAFEIDMSTETVDSLRDSSLRHRLVLYDAYQDRLLRDWNTAGRIWERPRFRAVFLTPSVPRAYHILAVAGSVARIPSRRLVLAASQDEYLGSLNPLQAPMFIDHQGAWQSLVDLHPTALSLKSPVRLRTVAVNYIAPPQNVS